MSEFSDQEHFNIANLELLHREMAFLSHITFLLAKPPMADKSQGI
jgi:hypothetical protein